MGTDDRNPADSVYMLMREKISGIQSAHSTLKNWDGKITGEIFDSHIYKTTTDVQVAINTVVKQDKYGFIDKTEKELTA